MPRYLIRNRIDTILNLWEPFDYTGYRFEPWEKDMIHGKNYGWMATKAIEEEDVHQAFREFDKGLSKAINKIAFIGQCYTSSDLQSFLIEKVNDNRFFLRHSKKRNPVPLHFGEKQIDSLSSIDKYKEIGDVFRYLREAVNATTFHTMLVMLASALEGMAGHIGKSGRIKLDKQFLIDEVLKDKDLVDRLFKYKDGIRHQILHGGFIDMSLHGDFHYNSVIYDKIVCFFNSKYQTKIDTGAKNAPRTNAGNYTISNAWCQWRDDSVRMSFQELDAVFDVDRPPKLFSHIDEPQDF